MCDRPLPSLEAVVDYYDRCGSADPEKSPLIRPLHLGSEGKRALAAFLRSLTDDNIARPSSVR